MSAIRDQLDVVRTQAAFDEPASLDPADTESSPVPARKAGEAQEPAPCPPPLAWQEVLAAFREESRPWTIERKGTSLCGRTWGDDPPGGARPPLYFLNGLAGTHELFALLVWLLRDDFRCVLFDYPRPRGRRTPERIEEYADDLLAVADDQGDDRFDLFAAAFGGLVALAALAEAPGRIGRAVIQGGYAHRRLSPVERLLIAVGRHSSRTLGSVRFAETILRRNHLSWFPPFDRSRYEFFRADAGGTPIRDIAELAALLRRSDLRPRLAEIETGVLLVRTEGDGPVCSAYQQELERGLPHARSEWMHTTGTIPHLTHPHRVAKLVREWLKVES